MAHPGYSSKASSFAFNNLGRQTRTHIHMQLGTFQATSSRIDHQGQVSTVRRELHTAKAQSSHDDFTSCPLSLRRGISTKRGRRMFRFDFRDKTSIVSNHSNAGNRSRRLYRRDHPSVNTKLWKHSRERGHDNPTGVDAHERRLVAELHSNVVTPDCVYVRCHNFFQLG